MKVKARDRNTEKSEADKPGSKGSANLWNKAVNEYSETRKKDKTK